MAKSEPAKLPVWKLVVAGAVGSLAPDIVLLYSKRWTMGSLQFGIGQYLGLTLAYMVLAGFVAAIFPYKGRASQWRAFQVGVSIPIVVGMVASLMRDRMTPRGSGALGSLLDLLSIF